MPLQYGSTVSALTRTVDSSVYANYVRAMGNGLMSVASNADANNTAANSLGTWQTVDNASTATVQSDLDSIAAGDLALDGVLVPTYTLTLRPGAYNQGSPNMGDTVPLIVQTGRLNVQTTVRVVGITYTIGDDGQEDIALTVGRPSNTLADIFAATDRDVNALARR